MGGGDADEHEGKAPAKADRWHAPLRRGAYSMEPPQISHLRIGRMPSRTRECVPGNYEPRGQGGKAPPFSRTIAD